MIGGSGDIQNPKETDVKDNLYLAVNGAWQEKAVIPNDRPSTGGFYDLIKGVEETLISDLHELIKDKSKIDDDELLQAVKLYELANDTEKLRKYHQKPILNDLRRISKLSSLENLSDNFADLLKNDFVLPLQLDVDMDMKNTIQNVVYLTGADLILPDKSYYADGNESGQKLLEKYAQVANHLLAMVGYSLDDSHRIVKQALDFDKTLVPIVKTPEEWADDIKNYNPMDFDEFITKSKNLDLKKFVVDSVGDEPIKVINREPRYLENLDKLVNPDTFENVKSWMIVRFLFYKANDLDEEFRQTVGEYRLALSGAKELLSRDKFAYHVAERNLDQVVGTYYGKKYFGEKAKKDVRQMVEKMISVYEERLFNNDWLSEATKKKAILKLKKMVLKIGYPDQVESIFSKIKVDENLSLYDNLAQINKIKNEDELSRLHQPVDRSKWLMPGHMVNASYDPQRNDITFPAAILQAPFYSLEQTSSQNFGGIGAVIAHEISHAFDNNGAQFDELGNINNWWTKEDYATFKQLTQKMIDEFDGISYIGKKVNGTLIVSENIADVGGLRCALEAAKAEVDYNAKEFFTNWARVWRSKSTEQLTEMLLALDVHAPDSLRANVQAQNMDEFYDAFDVTEKDGMWLDKDKRVNIW
ncbi:M13 family metallopeptidase [Companilactobacillus sp. HBUAS56275]|uniref:M13 family metallopeptidase n=1 Tax=Candidatus Companilactobacillus pullicola TaxID=2838523 RepID=A0A9D2CL64_9LACO|nr:M13 family metallopeptidase [Candidatus Companilactobacillus pullicola]